MTKANFLLLIHYPLIDHISIFLVLTSKRRQEEDIHTAVTVF